MDSDSIWLITTTRAAMNQPLLAVWSGPKMLDRCVNALDCPLGMENLHIPNDRFP